MMSTFSSLALLSNSAALPASWWCIHDAKPPLLQGPPQSSPAVAAAWDLPLSTCISSITNITSKHGNCPFYKALKILHQLQLQSGTCLFQPVSAVSLTSEHGNCPFSKASSILMMQNNPFSKVPLNLHQLHPGTCLFQPVSAVSLTLHQNMATASFNLYQ